MEIYYITHIRINAINSMDKIQQLRNLYWLGMVERQCSLLMQIVFTFLLEARGREEQPKLQNKDHRES